MADEKKNRIEKLIKIIPSLTDGQLYWLNRVIQIFDSPRQFNIEQSNLLDKATLENFGDALRIHHSFSAESFSKDKFEYVFEKVLNMSGHTAMLAPRGHRGHDIIIDNVQYSLKTQADKDIREDKIWISKFMELGQGEWGDDDDDLIGLRQLFLDHLKNYDRILTLRALEKGPQWRYELVEIPKTLMEDNLLVNNFAKFPRDTSSLMPGKFLCRLGYPFPEFTNYEHKSSDDNIHWTNTGQQTSPRFPIEGMVTRKISQNISGNAEIVGFEMSTPGLRGQSGGPVFDENGMVWGVQSQTGHLYLGFDVSQDVRKEGKIKKIKDSAFLHVGYCIHVDKIKEFLRQENIQFDEA